MARLHILDYFAFMNSYSKVFTQKCRKQFRLLVQIRNKYFKARKSNKTK